MLYFGEVSHAHHQRDFVHVAYNGILAAAHGLNHGGDWIDWCRWMVLGHMGARMVLADIGQHVVVTIALGFNNCGGEAVSHCSCYLCYNPGSTN